MPQFPIDLERPYGSLCGEGYSETPPSEADMLTVIPSLRNMFVRTTLETATLIEAYLPITPEPPRRCNLSLYNHIDNGLGVCRSYCKGALESPPGFFFWWFFQAFDDVFAAITEQALAVAELEKEMGRIHPALKKNATKEDRLRPIMHPLEHGSLVALIRAMNGTEILLDQTKRVLENTEDNPSSLGVVFQPVMRLKSHWMPVFGSYKKMRAALEKCQGVPQKQKGQRCLVDVAAFLAWLDAVKSVGTGMGFNPSDRSTWPDEVYDAIMKETAAHLREKRTVRDEKRHQNG